MLTNPSHPIPSIHPSIHPSHPIPSVNTSWLSPGTPEGWSNRPPHKLKIKIWKKKKFASIFLIFFLSLFFSLFFFFLSLSLFSFLFSPFSFFFWGAKKKWGSKKVGVKNGLYINISDSKCHHGTMVQLHSFIRLYAGSNPVGGKSHLWSRCSRRNFGLNCYRSTNILKTIPYFQ